MRAKLICENNETLIQSIENGSLEGVKNTLIDDDKIMEFMADPFILSLASAYGNYDIVKVLLNIYNKYENVFFTAKDILSNAINYAIKNNRYMIIKLLL